MTFQTRFAATLTAALGLCTIAGCGEGEMTPNAAPGVEAPGHGPSDGGSGNKPSTPTSNNNGDSSAPNSPSGTDSTSGSNPTPR